MTQTSDIFAYRPTEWLEKLGRGADVRGVDGLVSVADYDRARMRPEEVAIMEKAAHYGAQFVFFEAPRNPRPSVPQAFVYVSNQPVEDTNFAELHRRLWNWGGVPLVYLSTPGLVRIFRCAHKADFFKNGQLTLKAHDSLAISPVPILGVAAAIAEEKAWWDASRLRNGTLWDDPEICSDFLAADKSAHRKLVKAVGHLNAELTKSNLLTAELRRQLLILSLLIAYLEARGVLKPAYFGKYLEGATQFFHVLRNGPALVAMLRALKEWFNGDVFTLDPDHEDVLASSAELDAFATLVEGHQEPNGQLNFWRLYSFQDLPVELISEIYQLFVEDSRTAVYTPPALVRLILEEALSPDRMQRLMDKGEVVLDPACGSGVFLVEAYKRLVLHWRSQNGWKAPTTANLKKLIATVHGVDIEPSAVELTNFSLCLAMCDALKPRDIEASVKLFPELKGHSLHQGCFFEANAAKKLPENVGVVVGNPPFVSELKTESSRQSALEFAKENGPLPDKQLAYLFLHEAMGLLADGGLLAMIQPCGFLYNEGAAEFRRRFFERTKVREILDFVSVRGMFGRDTKVVVVVSEALPPEDGFKALHAVFRRSGRADAEQSFDIDYYDMHWLPQQTEWSDHRTWRAGLLGGQRVSSFVQRLGKLRTLNSFFKGRGWEAGQGFVLGNRPHGKQLDHIWGQPLVPPEAIQNGAIDRSKINAAPQVPISDIKSERSFRSPLLLIRKHHDLDHAVWNEGYLTFADEIFGVSAQPGEETSMREVSQFFLENQKALAAYVAASSFRLYNKKATATSTADIQDIPYPADHSLDLSQSEKIIAEDIVNYQRDLIRVGDQSASLKKSGHAALPAFCDIFTAPINAIYSDNPIVAHAPKSWPGIICQPFSFGDAEIDWTDSDSLRGKLDVLLQKQQNSSLSVTRIARIYHGNCLFLIKPDRLRFWLRSVALRDADDVLADLRAQGF